MIVLNYLKCYQNVRDACINTKSYKIKKKKNYLWMIMVILKKF